MDQRNDQLATFCYDLKCLAQLTSRPNIVLNWVKFYYTGVLFNKSMFSARIMTLER